jgi:chromosome segregation ATPase
MKRKFLEDLELDKDVIDKIMAENGRDIETAKGDLAEITTERDNLKKDIAARDEQIETLKKSAGNNEDLKKQIENLQAENKATKINGAIEKALTAAKALNVTAAKALLKDLDKAELSSDGTVKGLDEQIKALQKDENTKFLFAAPEESKKTTIKGMTPTDGGDDKPKGVTQKDFARMSYKDRLKLFNEDRETYNALSGKTTE